MVHCAAAKSMFVLVAHGQVPAMSRDDHHPACDQAMGRSILSATLCYVEGRGGLRCLCVVVAMQGFGNSEIEDIHAFRRRPFVLAR